MKKLNLWLLASLFMGAMAMTSCSSSDEKAEEPVAPQTYEPVTPANMKMSALSGFVRDQNGNALSDVTVTSGAVSVTTDAQGGFALSSVKTNNGRTIVKFEKAYYMDVVRSAEQVDGDIWEVVMVKKDTWGSYNYTSTNFDSSYGKSTTVDDMTVELQADGFKVEGGGNYTGVVYEDMLYLDPDAANFGDMMPGGDLAAERTDVNGAENAGQQVQLVSYGMTKVDLTGDQGQKLNLADGKPATMTFPVPDKFQKLADAGTPLPAEIPLWSFDEEKGLWIEEGMATYDATYNVYVGTVPHFSWVNLDYPEVRVRLTITVKDDKGNKLPGIKVDIDGQKNLTTNMSGTASGYVPKGQDFYVTVHRADYANYEMENGEENSENGEYKKQISAMDKDGSITIVLPSVAHLGGYIVNQGEGNNIATVWVEYDGGKETKRMHTDVDGKFYFIAPADYQGAAKLKVRGADGRIKSVDITLDGTDQTNLVVNFKSDVNAGGRGTITTGTSTINMVIPEISVENGGGVVIIDDYFTAENGDNPEGEEINTRFSFYLQGYKAGQTTYTENLIFSLMSWSGDGEEGGWAGEDANATITPLANGYHIVASAKGQLHGEQEEQLNSAQFSVDVTVPLYAKGGKKANVAEASSVLPSWAPSIPGKTIDYALAITESPILGQGGYIIYTNSDLGLTEFNALVAEATKVMGEPVRGSVEENYKTGNYYFQKDNKYLVLKWQGNWEPYTGYDFMTQNISMWNLTYTYDGIISVTAYDGYQLGKNYYVKAERMARKK